MRRPASITTTPSSKSSPTSTGAIREVRAAMLDVLRFWLDRGVDGFRVDVHAPLVKDDQFRDNPPNPDCRPGMSPYRELLTTLHADQPEVQEIIAEMRAVVDEYGDRMMVGEIYLPLERLMAYYGASAPGVHLPFNFQLIRVPGTPKRCRCGRALRSDAASRRLAQLGARQS